MSILFFDTETTGLPNFKLHPAAPQQPACLQLGALLTTSEGEPIEEYQTLIQIGSKPIHPMALKAHGISAEKANSEGIPPFEALFEFHRLVQDAEFLVCHNYSFDLYILKCMAYGLKNEEAELVFAEIEELPYKCTMRSTIQFCQLPFPSGRKGFKFPKLEELHRILFEEDFEGAHDAMADVRATHRCYCELSYREVI